MFKPETKKNLRSKANKLFDVAERKGFVPPRETFELDYHKDFPALIELEQNYEVIKAEVISLLENPEGLVDLAALNPKYAGPGGITWKTFIFKHESWNEKNCERCPKTAKLIAQIPGVSNAFFSVLGANQHIAPHWGFYRGFIRYHLGVLIPNDNVDSSCYLRINTNREENAQRNTALVERGEKYYWKPGQGVLFDDMYLHDAENGSNQVRVVLWLDLKKKFPVYLTTVNNFVIRHFGPIPNKTVGT